MKTRKKKSAGRKIKIRINGKQIEAEECKTIFSKMRGLMFRKNPKPLLFEFRKPTRQPIHSFFCEPFRAVWLRKDKIIDDKIVNPFRIFVVPKKKFTTLVEMPLKNKRK